MASNQAFIRPEYGALFFFDEKRFEKAIESKPSSERTKLFRTAITAGDTHLKDRFLEGEDIHKLVRDRSDFMDRILYYAWRQFEWDEGIGLMAVGGYGRGEMHPHSDIDLLFILRKDKPKKYERSISEFLTFLWDLQLKIGHSVRTVKQCVAAAKADVTVMTNLLEVRTIVGPADFNGLLAAKINKIPSAESFFVAKVEEQKQRHARHGITEFDLEPNVKESPGGLRDIQTINWVAKRTYQVSGLEKLAGKGFYTEEEYNSLRSAEDFLWRVRFGLHVQSDRPLDHLQFEYQRQLAEQFGYKDTDERLAVEQFMQRYYQAATIVREINDVLIQLMEEEIRGSNSVKVQSINERLQLRGSYIETTSDTVFRDSPSALIEIFVLMSRDKKIEGIHAGTIRQIREYGNLIDDDFRADPENRRLFVQLLKAEASLSSPLQKMSRYAVLGRYLPEFGKIVGLTQHDLFHIYPVDIHTLAVVRNIRAFRLPESRKAYPVSSYTYASYPKPEILVIAGLYHDIAKGRGGDHSELGAAEVTRFAENHGFTPTEVRLMAWLVENHLFMSRVAQREDISDPEVIANFARHVGDETRLNLLYSLTTADILATNPTLWNNWRASLMRQLYNATRKFLRTGLDQVVDKQELIQETVDSASKRLNNAEIPKQEFQSFWDDLDENYFLRESPEDIEWHTRLLIESDGIETPTVEIKPYVNYHRERATVLFVRVPRSPYLFYSAAAAVSNVGLSIQDARLYAAKNSSFLTMYLLDESAEAFHYNETRIGQLKKTLERELTRPHAESLSRGKRTSRQLKQLPVPTQTIFSNFGNQSTLEVVTADRPALLATVAAVFLKHEIFLRSAKITTLGERVEDLFVIENAYGEPISDPQLIIDVQEDIRQTIDQKVEAISSL